MDVTDVGLPHSWMWVRLADVLAEPLVNGQASHGSADGFPVLKLTALTEAGVDFTQVSEDDRPRGWCAPLLAGEGDFLVARSSGSGNRIGRGALARNVPGPVAVPGGMTRVRVSPEVLTPGFLEPVWASAFVRHQLEKAAGRASRKSLNHRSLEAIRLPLPPVEEQHRIAAVLRGHMDRLDRGREVLRAAFARLPALRAAARRATTPGGDPLLGDVPPGWTLGKISDVVCRIEAGTSLPNEARPARSGEWGVIKTSAMTRGVFRDTEHKAVRSGATVNPGKAIEPNDVLVCRANSRDYVGTAVLVAGCRPQLLLSDKSLRLEPKPGVDRRWLVHLLASPYVREQIARRSRGCLDSMQNITQRDLLEIPIPVPPSGEQERLGRMAQNWITGADRLSEQIQTATARAARLRQGLVDAACAGRLVPQEPGERAPTQALLRLRTAEPARGGPPAQSPRGRKKARAALSPAMTTSAVQLEFEL
ncbi:hypothetical protein [Streptomyces sp. NPDC005507]|uniref:hypothetical protein n=1 Tax=Streptomyces sp. NPDC005507 TaxID=3154885 RepID=UPI0033BA05C8